MSMITTTLARMRHVESLLGLEAFHVAENEPLTFTAILAAVGIDEALLYTETVRPEHESEVYQLAADIVAMIKRLHPDCEKAIKAARDYAEGIITTEQRQAIGWEIKGPKLVNRKDPVARAIWCAKRALSSEFPAHGAAREAGVILGGDRFFEPLLLKYFG